MAAVMVQELPAPNPEVIPSAKKMLGNGIRARLRALYQTQEQAARALGMTPTNISPLFVGKYDRFSLAWLLQTASRVGLNVEIETVESAECA
jgi:predicted XRE-type DNA-binding protein